MKRQSFPSRVLRPKPLRLKCALSLKPRLGPLSPAETGKLLSSAQHLNETSVPRHANAPSLNTLLDPNPAQDEDCGLRELALVERELTAFHSPIVFVTTPTNGPRDGNRLCDPLAQPLNGYPLRSSCPGPLALREVPPRPSNPMSFDLVFLGKLSPRDAEPRSRRSSDTRLDSSLDSQSETSDCAS